MRVLVGSFFFYPYEGGAEKQGRLLARELVRRGVHVDYVTARLPGTKAREVVDGVQVYRLPFGPQVRGLHRIQEIFFYWHLRKFLLSKASDYDIFQAQGVFDIVAPTMARVARQNKVRTILRYASVSEIERLRAKSLIGSVIWREVLQGDWHVTNSPITLARMITDYGLTEDRCLIIPNAVEMPEPIDRAYVRKELDWSSDLQIVVCVSKFDPLKNQAVLIKAWQNIARQFPFARFVLIGSGRTQSDCKALSEELGLTEKIIFTGALPNPQVKRYLAASDIFVFPSKSEGQSNVLLEAMASSLPCAVSDIPANRVVARPDIEALYFAPDDDAAAATAISRLLSDSSLADRLALAANSKVQCEYSLTSVADQYANLYRKILTSD